MDSKTYNAYLMVEFNDKTKLPESIRWYTESEYEITTLGINEYVRIADMEWNVYNDEKEKDGLGILFDIVEEQLQQDTYDSCSFLYQGKKWTVEECKKLISLKSCAVK